MIKIVLDTNVLISALIKTGKPKTLFYEIVKGKAQLILSMEILDEFARTLGDPEIRKYVDEEDAVKFLRVVGSVAKIVKIKSRFKVVEEDPSDDVILRTAYDGKARYIVSGDEHLLSLKEFRGIKMVTVAEILELLS